MARVKDQNSQVNAILLITEQEEELREADAPYYLINPGADFTRRQRHA
jgi:hypothetical protein